MRFFFLIDAVKIQWGWGCLSWCGDMGLLAVPRSGGTVLGLQHLQLACALMTGRAGALLSLALLCSCIGVDGIAMVWDEYVGTFLPGPVM